MSVLENAKDLQNMMAQGNTWDAFEKYYHDDVTVIEIPNGETRQGKDAQRKALKEWFDTIKEFHDGGVLSVCANENDGVSTAESWMDVSFKSGGRWKMSEVAVQKWKDGQIIEEKFYYHMPQQ